MLTHCGCRGHHWPHLAGQGGPRPDRGLLRPPCLWIFTCAVGTPPLEVAGEIQGSPPALTSVAARGRKVAEPGPCGPGRPLLVWGQQWEGSLGHLESARCALGYLQQLHLLMLSCLGTAGLPLSPPLEGPATVSTACAQAAGGDGEATPCLARSCCGSTSAGPAISRFPPSEEPLPHAAS